MQKIEPFVYGNYYHIYNRGINSCNLFVEQGNYEYFMKLYDKYIAHIADTYAWVLMPNHFHFLVRVREKFEAAEAVLNPSGFQNPDRVNSPSLQFSKLFNSYAQAFNKRYKRHGALFERPFKRKLIDNEPYLRHAIIYIHNNPVHHGFTESPGAYPWSSYLTCLTDKTTKLQRNEVLDWFGGRENFKFLHHQNPDSNRMEKWLGI